MTADDQLDEWTPEAMANFDAAHARLISTLDQFTAGLRTAMPTAPRAPSWRRCASTSTALSSTSTARAATSPASTSRDRRADLDDEDESLEDEEAADPEDGAGLGVAVIWRFDLRVDGRACCPSGPERCTRELPRHGRRRGRRPHRRGRRGAAGDHRAGRARGADGRRRPHAARRPPRVRRHRGPARRRRRHRRAARRRAGGPEPWTREVGAIFLPAEGEIGITEGSSPTSSASTSPRPGAAVSCWSRGRPRSTLGDPGRVEIAR